MITRLQLSDRTVWLKRYDGRLRRVRLGVLNWFTRCMELTPLRPPPRHRSAAARRTEQRRLLELRKAGVLVPEVIAAGEDALLLSDLGPTLASRLRCADPEQARMLTASAIDAVIQVHAVGAYLGQPVARNITADESGRIGFLDFEEDPAEVMALADAQARDWLLFVAGISRYSPGGDDDLERMLRGALDALDTSVLDRIDRTVRRLGFVERCSHYLGRRAQGLGKALRALRSSTPLWLLLLLSGLVIGLDLAQDGDLDFVIALDYLLF